MKKSFSVSFKAGRRRSLQGLASGLLIFSLLLLSACASPFFNQDQSESETGERAFHFTVASTESHESASADLSTTTGAAPRPLSSTISGSSQALPSSSLGETSVGTGSTNGARSLAEFYSQSEESQGETNPSDAVALPSTQTIESRRPAATLSTEKALLFLKPAGAESVNEEPPVPLSVVGSNPIRGIAGHRVERFFKTLSTNPIYYHYVMHSSSEGEKGEESISEVMLALSDNKSYMRIDTMSSAIVLLQTDEEHYYQMDLMSGKVETLSVEQSKNADLSLYAFQQLEANASFFIFTGMGEAVFFGRPVHFEEYTMDGSEFIRYYFIGDVTVGHRSFRDGKILQTVEVEEASNKLDPTLFELPDAAVTETIGMP